MEINVSLEEELIVVKRLNELNVQAQEQVEMMEHFQFPYDWGGNGGTFSIPSVRLWQCPDPPCNWCLIVVILSREIKGSTWYPPIPGWVPRQPGRFYQHINMKISKPPFGPFSLLFGHFCPSTINNVINVQFMWLISTKKIGNWIGKKSFFICF